MQPKRMQQYLDYLNQLPAGAEKLSFHQYEALADRLDIEESVRQAYERPAPEGDGGTMASPKEPPQLRLVVAR